MKKIIVVFASVLLTISGFSQQTADIGIWGGTSSYIGDLRNTPPIQGFNPNFGAYFRYNFNSRVGLRIMAISGKSAAEGTYMDYPFTYSKITQDFSAQVEINYLRFIIGNKKTRFSPYILGGLGVSYFPYHLDPGFISNFNPNHNKGGAIIDESVFATTIPFGFGVKYSLGKRLSVGAEYLMRKLLSDKFDDLDDPLAFVNSANNTAPAATYTTYTDDMHNNDWPGYLGVHMTFMIYIGKKACPAYDSKVK